MTRSFEKDWVLSTSIALSWIAEIPLLESMCTYVKYVLIQNFLNYILTNLDFRSANSMIKCQETAHKEAQPNYKNTSLK